MRKDRITSLELLKQINYFRKQEGNRAELRHDTLLKIIRDEFSEDFNALKFQEVNAQNILAVNEGNISLVNEQKKLPVTDKKDWQNILPMSEGEHLLKIEENSNIKIGYYKDKKGEKRPMYILTLSQGKQVLVRESKFVRRATIQYLEKLEKKLLQIAINMSDEQWLELREHEKATRKLEMDTVKELVSYAKEQGSKHPEKLYTVYSMLVRRLLGDESKDRDALPLFDTLDVLRLQQVIRRVIQQGMKEKKHYKEIYKDCQKAGSEYINAVKIA